MESPSDKYAREHSRTFSARQQEALDWIERATNIRTNYPHMLSGKIQGAFLKMLVELAGASRVLEIGTFTGYSAACLASALPEGGRVDTLEINDELEDLAREGWDRAGVSDRITLHIGNALEIIPNLGEYDTAFIDANKREYAAYFEAVLPHVRQGGFILVDDTLWDGKVYEENPSCDAQTRSLIAFNDALASDSRVETVLLPIRHGLTIARKL